VAVVNRMMLIRASDRWVVKTSSGVEWPEKWNSNRLNVSCKH